MVEFRTRAQILLAKIQSAAGTEASPAVGTDAVVARLPVALRAPFMSESKSGILTIGLGMGLSPEHYAQTWTCYEGGEHPCGKCGACVERAEAFEDNGVTDPLQKK